MTSLGVGIGWRPELDLTIEEALSVDFVEVLADNIDPRRIPRSLRVLRERGMPVILHSTGLSLGGAERPERARLRGLARLAEALDAPLVSDHVAFVRAGGVEAGHLLPVPRTRDALSVVVENIRIAQDHLPVPLALENIAALFAWPEDALSETQFISELIERTGAHLLLDVENLYANSRNFGFDPFAALARLPLERVGYVHVAGGTVHDGLWHDTHMHPVPEAVFDLLEAASEATTIPGALLERDGAYPSNAELRAELDEIRVRLGGHRVGT
jgi:uncharacterized protein (UPF0276 family)